MLRADAEQSRTMNDMRSRKKGNEPGILRSNSGADLPELATAAMKVIDREPRSVDPFSETQVGPQQCIHRRGNPDRQMIGQKASYQRQSQRRYSGILKRRG